VYQKDLGKKTEVLAKGMKEYNPDSSWQKTEEQEETAANRNQVEGKSRNGVNRARVRTRNEVTQRFRVQSGA